MDIRLRIPSKHKYWVEKRRKEKSRFYSCQKADTSILNDLFQISGQLLVLLPGDSFVPIGVEPGKQVENIVSVGKSSASNPCQKLEGLRKLKKSQSPICVCVKLVK